MGEWQTKYPRQEKYANTLKGKAARAKAWKKWSSKNREIINANKRRRYYEQKEIVSRIKIERGCVDCGYDSAPEALDFDHLYDKKYAIAKKYGQVSDETLLKEIEKCEIRCSNCHRIETVRRRKKDE